MRRPVTIDPASLGRTRRRPLLAAAILCLAGGAASALDQAGTIPAGRRCFTNTIRVSGYVIGRSENYVAASPDGYRITDVLVQEGDTVTLDQELVRVVSVGDQGGAPGGPGGGAPPAGGQGGVRTPISLRAPSAGLIVKSTAKIGSILDQKGPDPLFRIQTSPELDVAVDIPSIYASQVPAGTKARLFVEGAREIETVVRVGAASVDPAAQFGRAIITVPSRSGLRPGDFARAIVTAERTCGLEVPRTALRREAGSSSVMVRRADGRNEIRQVRLGVSTENSIEILGGLREGESVVTDAIATR